MRAREVLGKKVVTRDGGLVGRVADLELTDDWRVPRLILSLRREAARSAGARFPLRPKSAIKSSAVAGVGEFVTLTCGWSELSSVLEKI